MGLPVSFLVDRGALIRDNTLTFRPELFGRGGLGLKLTG